MYPTNYNPYNYNYGQEVYSNKYEPLDNSYPSMDERQFFPWLQLGGLFGPQQGPPSTPPPFGQPGVPQGPPAYQPPMTPPGQIQGGPPTAPPPSAVPTETQQVGVFAVDPGSIRGCLYRYTYIWLNNRQQFWFYPIYVGRRSVAGYRWIGYRWVYYGVDLEEVKSFTCV